MNGRQIFNWSIRFVVLLILYYVFFISGTLAITGLLPDVSSEPGLLPNDIGLLIIGIANTVLIILLILSSRWYGWKLAISLAFAYYGAVTFQTQIESWYFLLPSTIDEQLLLRLFMMGLPLAFVYIPLAVWILRKGKANDKDKIKPEPSLRLPPGQWIWKLMVIALVYLVLYWGAGYFIAWQNPNLRAFYGSPGDIVPFWEHTANTLAIDPGLFPFQILRALLWTLCALPIILGSKMHPGYTTILLGLFFTIPQCLGLLIENPLMPDASVRLSHLIEVGTSNFVFAMIISWLLHREHQSVQDLLGMKHKIKKNEKDISPSIPTRAHL
ncbi:hypothetical protein WJR50_11640 [Catalinimonas sp. 4WD22]|uniref:hypothetical protein n=1 Tax=Catalinimonas locisalis TaxID=3133978 RepID=UPI0031015711